MDTRRRRLLRQKYLKEEERLGKMSRGLSYDNNDDSSEEDAENEGSRFAPHVPKYKARTFRNILRDYDDPDFDERQNYMQDYQREEIIPEEPKDFVEPRHLTAPTQRKNAPSSPEPEELTDTEAPETEEVQEEFQETIEEESINQDEADELETESYEEDHLDDFDFNNDEAEEEEEDDSPSLDLPKDYQPQPIRRRKTLRQIEADERRRQKEASNLQDRRIGLRSYNESPRTKTPRPIRWLAFFAFIMLAFLGGYYICGGVLRIMNVQPSSEAQVEQQTTDNTSLPEQPQETKSDTTASTQASANVKSTTIFVPKGGSLVSINIEQKEASSNEQMLKGILGVYLDSVKEIGLLSTATELTEIWIGGDTLYLSMNQNFVSDLRRLSAQSATLLMRGFLRTINTNMSSVKKLKVFIDSQEITITQPIDLTKAWESM